MSLTVVRVVPVLRSFDEAKAKAFYCDFLGFTVDFEHRYEPGMPLFMQLKLGEALVQLSEHHGDATPGSSARFIVTGLASYHQAISAKGYGNARPGIEQTEWGADEMTVLDPFGNRLIFTQYRPDGD
jgi:uncharacterized glyoxalase superfamily protein PhnB